MNATNIRTRYLQRFKNSRAPISGMFELTGRCNLNCKMCYVHTKSNAEYLKTERNGDWWIAQIDAACEKGMLFATLSGGECLLHADFCRIYLHLLEKGVYTQVNTNGLLLTDKYIEFFKSNKPLEIQLSLYGAHDDAYEQVTGVRAFTQIQERIKQALDNGLNLRVTVTPNAYAHNKTAQIIEYLKKNQIPYGINEALISPYDETSRQTLSDKDADTEEKIRYLKAQSAEMDSVRSGSYLPPIGGKAIEEVRGIQCSAGRVSFVITHDGNMIPCTSMYHLRVPVNTAEDFGMAWERMLDIGTNFLMPIECEGCAYRKACLSCPILRGGKVGNGHCDPAVCEMTRQLVVAGVKQIEEKESVCE